jgi:hypothetical protein
MGKVVTAVLGICVILAGAWYALHHTGGDTSAGGASAPKRQLENVHQSAERIEADADKRVEDLEEKMKIAQ